MMMMIKEMMMIKVKMMEMKMNSKNEDVLKEIQMFEMKMGVRAVSYTHLTLPTIA